MSSRRAADDTVRTSDHVHVEAEINFERAEDDYIHAIDVSGL